MDSFGFGQPNFNVAAERRRQEERETRLPPHLQQPVSVAKLYEREARRWENDAPKQNQLEQKLRREREAFRRALKEKMVEKSRCEKAARERLRSQHERLDRERSQVEQVRQAEEEVRKKAACKLLESTAYSEWSWSPSGSPWGKRLGQTSVLYKTVPYTAAWYRSQSAPAVRPPPHGATLATKLPPAIPHTPPSPLRGDYDLTFRAWQQQWMLSTDPAACGALNASVPAERSGERERMSQFVSPSTGNARSGDGFSSPSAARASGKVAKEAGMAEYKTWHEGALRV